MPLLRPSLVASALACASFASPALAQVPAAGFSVAGWTTEQGLPSNVVLDVRQARDGYLWLASYQGLVRFDGVGFRLFDRDTIPGLRQELFLATAEDRDGVLWAATENAGLVRHARGRFSVLTTKDGLRTDKIGALHLGPSGRLWVGQRPGLSTIERGRVATVPGPPAGPEPMVTAIAEDREGGVWVGTVRDGLRHRARDGRWTTLTTATGLADDRVMSLLVDRTGTLWVGTYGTGVTRVRDGRPVRVGATGSHVPRRVNEFLEDAEGTIWLGADNGLFRLRGDTLQPVTRADGRPFLQVEALHVDAEGSLWVGTRPSGLYRVRRASFAQLGRAHGLPHDLAYAVTGDGAGGQWVATLGGLAHVTGARTTTYTVRGGALRDDAVRDVVLDSAGVVWAATNGGLTRVAGAPARTFTTRDGLPDDRVRVLLPARDGALWIGTMHGLAALRDGRVRAWGAADGLRDPYVLSLFEDRDGTLWVGTQTEGLFRRAGGRFVPGPAALAGQPVFRLHQGADGALWAGTTRGLVRVKGDSVTRIGARHGLPGDVVFQMVEDGTGHAWLTGTWGVARVRTIDLEAVAAGRARRLDAKLFGAGDGMPVREASALSKAWRAPDGALWFPTPAGVARVEPGRLRPNRRPPPVHVAAVVAGLDTVAAGDSAVLPAGTRRLELHWAGLGFVQPASLRFRYRLEGVDDDWVEVSRRTAYYTNVPPGRYVFRVQARNEDGVWNEAGVSMAVRMLPHPWQTTWFRVLAGLALAGGAALALRHRLRRVRHAVREVERERATRRVTAILESISDGFVALDDEWRFTYVNHTAEAILGKPRRELLGRVCWQVIPAPVARRVEAPLREVAAARAPRVLDPLLVEVSGRWIEMHGYPAEEGISIYFGDVTTRVHAEEALRGLSLRDDLTGLYNRRGLVALAEQQMRLADRTREGFAVLFVDLDGLKQVNDALGHPAGDQALVDAGAILAKTLRDSDVIARLGGDEFAAIVTGDADAVTEVGMRVRDAVDQHNATAGRPYAVSLSLGYSRFDPEAPVAIDELLRVADRRMYEEKRLKGAARITPL